MNRLTNRLSQQQSYYLGIGLIGLGLVAAMGLWGLLPVLVLASAGVYAYTDRRKVGNLAAAVQWGLWLNGLALLLLLGAFLLPGVLLLGGASFLVRGREAYIDQQIGTFLARVGLPLAPAVAPSAAPMVYQPTPAPAAAPAQPEAQAADTSSAMPATGETTRL